MNIVSTWYNLSSRQFGTFQFGFSSKNEKMLLMYVKNSSEYIIILIIIIFSSRRSTESLVTPSRRGTSLFLYQCKCLDFSFADAGDRAKRPQPVALYANHWEHRHTREILHSTVDAFKPKEVHIAFWHYVFDISETK